MALSPGDPGPDFVLFDDHDVKRTLMEFRGARVLLFFYPAAMTPGCTKEACDFRDNLALLNDAGLQVLGISPDMPAKLSEFREAHHLTFPLLSDPEREVLSAYGAYGEKTMYGKKVMGVIRSTIVLNARGDVEHAFYNVKATGHVAKLIRDLGLDAD